MPNMYLKDKLERFNMRLDGETAKFLREDAASLGMSASAYLRMLVCSRRASLATQREIQASTTRAIDEFTSKALSLLSAEDVAEFRKYIGADKAHENNKKPNRRIV